MHLGVEAFLIVSLSIKIIRGLSGLDILVLVVDTNNIRRRDMQVAERRFPLDLRVRGTDVKGRSTIQVRFFASATLRLRMTPLIFPAMRYSTQTQVPTLSCHLRELRVREKGGQ